MQPNMQSPIQPGCQLSEALSDDDLMSAVLAGDRQAFQQLVQRWKQPLMGYFYRQLGQRELCEELVQDLFIKLWNTRRFQAQGQFRSWLFRMAHNLRVDYLRKHRRELAQRSDAEFQHLAMPEHAQPEARLLSQEQQAELQSALLALPEQQRELLVLSRFHGFKNAQIAELTGASPNTVKVQVFRALKKLAQHFQEVKHAGFYLLFAGLGLL